MAALTAAKPITQLGEDTAPMLRDVPVKDGVVIYHGAMVGVAGDGYWAPASTTVAALGVADLEAWDDQARSGQASVQNETTGNKIDNSAGADDARQFVVRQGIFKMANKGGDLVTRAMVGATVYVEDDQTVRLTATGSVAAGKLWGFADDGLPLVRVQV